MSFPRYPRYKDSGVEWLGEVPEHWVVERLKRIAHVFPSNVDKKTVDGELPVRLCNYTDVYYNDTISDAMDFMSATATAEQVEKFTLRAGDTIITKDSETADDIAIGAFVPKDLPGVVCGYHLSVVRPDPGSDGAFIKRFFDSAYARSSVAVLANGLTRVGLGQYALDNLEVPLPPREEQSAIAIFLARETAKIDALVAEQQRLMELLSEKRQAVISHAVTKGLNPDAPMKPSGVEWLGEVPAHWEVQQLKRSFRSVDYGISESLQPEGAVAILRMGNIVEGQIRADDMKFTSAVDPTLMLSSGDLLYNRTNSLDLIGKVGLFKENEGCPTSFASYLVRLRVVEQSVPEFFAFLLNTEGLLGRARADAFVSIGQCNLNPTRYGQIIVGTPPKDEQLAIAECLAIETERIALLAFEAQCAVALLQERRSAVISAAVTGQIDVRRLATAEAA